MRKRFSVVERELAAVEEVSGRLNHFVSDDGKEVTNLDRQIAHRYFTVQLWKSVAIGSAVIPLIVEVFRVGNTERLRVWGIGTIDMVDSCTEAYAFAAVSNFLCIEPLLTKLNSIRIIVETEVVILGVIANACPPTNRDSGNSVGKKFPGIP